MQEGKLSWPAALGALGVVYGDIGTSPLYALDTAVAVSGGGAHDVAAMMGVLSLIFWSLLIVVTLQYVVFMLRADNQGEGGILALFALVQRKPLELGRWARWVVALALAGAALFYCDALITPAISVLSAVEGLKMLDPELGPIVLPTTVAVLVLLFVIQRRGTARIGKLFGPVMVLWFVAIGVSGAVSLARNPAVLLAINPLYGIDLLAYRPGLALAILGAVFLALTGGEALYADMGHFGKGPVRLAWFALVWPALLLSYFGQGAYRLSSSAAVDHSVFALVPAPLLAPLVVVATAATVIASQAVISGAFSVTRQAVQLDLLPRMRVLQTSAQEAGQIYVPVVNYFLLVAVLGFVLAFGSSAALASAYGAAVAGTMVVTTLLGRLVAVNEWHWSSTRAFLVFGGLFAVCVAFLAGNLTKVIEGAWVPILLATLLFIVFTTWRDGRLRLRAALGKLAVPIANLSEVLEGVARVSGTAVFLASDADYVPSALLRNLEHNHVAHERIIILHLEIMRQPRWDPADRVRITTVLPEVYVVNARFGFMDTLDVNEALRRCRTRGLRMIAEENTFFLGWHLVSPRPRPGWAGLRSRFFAWMQRRSTQAAEFFRMPSRRVVILATDVEL